MSRRRYRGSVIGTYVKPTTTTASGVYDLDTAIINTGLARWPAATAGSYRIPGLIFFAQGQKYQAAGNNYGAYTLMSYYSAAGTLVSESNPAGMTSRAYSAAAGYDIDKAVIHGGRYGGSNSQNYVNLVSNTGTVAADDTTSAPSTTTTLEGHGAATYGFINVVFLWGFRVNSGSTLFRRGIAKMNNLAVWTAAVDTTYYHLYSAAVGYGTDRVLGYAPQQYVNGNGTGSTGGQALVYIDGNGTIGAEQTWAHSTTNYWSGSRYGTDTAVLVDFSGATKYYALVTNTGTIGSDTSVTMASAWTQPVGTALPGGSALFAYGQYNSSNTIRPMITISNTGVFGSVTTVTENTNQSRCAAGYS